MKHLGGIDSFPWAFEGRVPWSNPGYLARLAVVAMVWVLSGVSILRAQAPPTEYEVKTAYLYQFGKFVEWPEEMLVRAGDVFSICTLGLDPFGSLLDQTIAERSVQGKKVVAKRLASVNDALNCNILFISSSEQSRLEEILKVLQGKSILTVGDMRDFIRQGGMINFQIVQNKVRFEINLPAVERANLKVSSQLLKVAELTKE